MLLLRKILFYIFAAAYVILCPLTIFYAIGYLYKPGFEQGLVTTGLIYIATSPPGAAIYVENKRFAHKTPAVLRDLMPGDFTIKLLLKGRKSWIQTVPVESKKATTLEKILLLPETLTPKVLARGEFRRLFPLPGNDFFLVASGTEAGKYTAYDWRSEKLFPLLPDGSPYAAAPVSEHFASSGSPQILFKLKVDNAHRYLSIQPKHQAPEIQDLTGLFVPDPSRVSWDADDNKNIFVYSGGSLYRINTSAKTLTPLFLDHLKGFDIADRHLTIIRENNVLARLNLDAEDAKILLEDHELAASLFSGVESIRIHRLAKNLLVFLGDKGELFANRLPYRFAESGILEMQYHEAEERLLVWSKNALGVIDFSKEEREEGLFERGPALRWIYKKGLDISQAFWVYDASHILFCDKSQIFLLELETYGKPRMYALHTVRESSSIFYSEDSGELYYLDQDGKLCSIPILPRVEFRLPPFPEKPEEKKKAEIQELD